MEQTAEAETVLEVRGLTRRYGREPNGITALDGVDLTVAPGEMVAVMGPSGSGKSTLLSIAGGLEEASSGQVRVGGVDLGQLDAAAIAALRRRTVGYVFQDLNLLVGLTVLENVTAPQELDGIPAARVEPEARQRLSEVGMADRADAFPDDLSGGERQRVAIARALVGDRTLLLADEPTGALDTANGKVVAGLLRSACTGGRAVVLATHDRDLARWADRVIHLRDGRLDPTEPDLTASPEPSEVRR